MPRPLLARRRSRDDDRGRSMCQIGVDTISETDDAVWANAKFKENAQNIAKVRENVYEFIVGRILLDYL